MNSADGHFKTRVMLTRSQAIAIYRVRLENKVPKPIGRTTAAAVARMYGVNEKTVRDIWNGRTWRKDTESVSLSIPPENDQSISADPGLPVLSENQRAPFLSFPIPPSDTRMGNMAVSNVNDPELGMGAGRYERGTLPGVFSLNPVWNEIAWNRRSTAAAIPSLRIHREYWQPPLTAGEAVGVTMRRGPLAPW
jgi:hypothetical protein